MPTPHDNLVLNLNQDDLARLKMVLQDHGFIAEDTGKGFRARGGDVTITAYHTGKVLVQGKGAPEALASLQQRLLPPAEGDVTTGQGPGGWIGTDESGKGDFFGPLVVAGVYLDSRILPRIEEIGVRDSKMVPDASIPSLAGQIKASTVHSVVTIGPGRYNELYREMKNLNRILAWGHARVLENLLARVDCGRALTDKFGDERYVRSALMKRGRQLHLEQRPRAEEDPAVAAASILARDEFLRRLEMLSRKTGVSLPKGASPAVEEAGRLVVARHGAGVLAQVAKLHFKNTSRILPGEN